MSNKIDLAIAEAGEAVARVTSTRLTEKWIEAHEAHARQIAAIPDMVAKLKELYAWLDTLICDADAGITVNMLAIRKRDTMRKMAEITEVLDKAGAL